MGANRVSGMAAQDMLNSAGEANYGDDAFLNRASYRQDESAGEQSELPPYDPMYGDGQAGRSPSMGSEYTRDSIGNWKLRPNEMQKWMENHPDPQPKHRATRWINPADALGIPDVTRASFQSQNDRASGASAGSVEPRRSDRVFGQYRRTFGERMKATGGGIGGFFKALFGKGMRRANIARYGS